MPWDVPEMAVDLSSTGRILLGRDARSIRVLVPDCRVLDQNFHDVTVLEMRKAARVQYQKKQPAPCEFCGTLIRCDMYRHVACCHLDLAQLSWCPMSWCTVWKGTPQDLMDHVRGAHKVPEEVQHIKLETLFPPWTVTRQVYADSLTSQHSGISNDVLLFSDIGLSLVHHYRVHKRGLPHVAFRRNYMSQLCALLPLPAVLPIERGSPDPECSSVVESPDVVCASPRPSRRALARRRPTRVMETPVRIAPRLTIQDPLAAAGQWCLTAALKCYQNMDVSGTDLAEIRSMTRAGVVTAVPPEREQSFGGGGGGLAKFDLSGVGRDSAGQYRD